MTLLGNRVIEDAVSFAGVTLEESKPIILRDVIVSLDLESPKRLIPGYVCEDVTGEV